jgi:DNA-binding transcriptional regulator LsrR (DeoR family)
MQATLAARRYFVDGWTIKQMAAELGVSRFKAARLLDWAKAEGLVRIEIVSAAYYDLELGARLRTLYGLRDALVVAGLDGSTETVARELADAAAHAVAEIVTASDVVGISWGRTLDLLVESLPEFHVRRVVQLIGGLATLESASGGIDLVRRFAARAQTNGYPLLAPVLVRDVAAAESLRRDPIVAEALRLIDDVTVVVAGVGAWGDCPASRLIDCFDGAEIEELKRQGVSADMCGFLFAHDGSVLHPWAEKRIGISLAKLEAARMVIAVAGGSEKRDALRAILRSGTVDVVVTDAGSATALLL